MRITQIVKFVGGGGFSGNAHHLANQFVQKGVESSLVTGCVLDKPDGPGGDSSRGLRSRRNGPKRLQLPH